jgi:hypothetical protein
VIPCTFCLSVHLFLPFKEQCSYYNNGPDSDRFLIRTSGNNAEGIFYMNTGSGIIFESEEFRYTPSSPGLNKCTPLFCVLSAGTHLPWVAGFGCSCLLYRRQGQGVEFNSDLPLVRLTRLSVSQLHFCSCRCSWRSTTMMPEQTRI